MGLDKGRRQASAFLHFRPASSQAGNGEHAANPQTSATLGLQALAIVILSIALATLPGSAPAAHAAGTIHVNTLSDEYTGGDGTCSLGEAIISADGGSPYDSSCSGYGSGSTIDFTVTGTITLTQLLPSISSNMTIAGPAGGITIDGNHSFNMFIVNSSQLTLENLTLANGNGGVGGNPGAIWNGGGTVNVYSSTLSNNANPANPGGAIFNYNNGKLNIVASTVMTSTASGSGGAIYNSSGTVAITNSTFISNTGANGGVVANSSSGVVTITNSTLYGNTMGLYNAPGGSMTVRNTIVASNVGYDCSGTIADGGYNLDGLATCAFSLADHSLSNTDPQLAPLANNGGPTETLALYPTSPAINAGTNTGCPSTDQRGWPRPTGPACDIGAYEYRALLYLPLVLK